MIDIHSHILPGIDDGAPNDDVSLAMALMAVEDGIQVMACTPHVMPPRYPNDTAGIVRAAMRLRALVQEAGIDLHLVTGGDVHLTHDLGAGLASGRIPFLHRSHYFLLEPDHQILTPHLDRFCTGLMARGYRPVLTHPERLAWMSAHLDLITRLHQSGVVMQVTAGSLTGRFGSEPRRLAEHMLENGLVDVLATDAHNLTSRPPVLSQARDLVADRYGDELAKRLVYDNPLAILSGHDIVRTNSGITAA